jgi:hypothetical protein
MVKDFAWYGSKGRMVGKAPIAGQWRVAAPLLGGVRGWVYFNATRYVWISVSNNLLQRAYAKNLIPGCFYQAVIPISVVSYK